MDIETAVVGIGVLIAFLAYLETVRRDLKSDIKSLEERLSRDIKEIQVKLDSTQDKHHELDNRLYILETRVGYLDDDTRKSNGLKTMAFRSNVLVISMYAETRSTGLSMSMFPISSGPKKTQQNSYAMSAKVDSICTETTSILRRFLEMNLK